MSCYYMYTSAPFHCAAASITGTGFFRSSRSRSVYTHSSMFSVYRCSPLMPSWSMLQRVEGGGGG
jgi:hypothetical protein